MMEPSVCRMTQIRLSREAIKVKAYLKRSPKSFKLQNSCFKTFRLRPQAVSDSLLHLSVQTNLEQLYTSEKVAEWCVKMNQLTKMLYFAYAAYIHAEQHRCTYVLCTHGIKDLLKPSDDIISNKCIRALFGSNIECDGREILSLPINLA